MHGVINPGSGSIELAGVISKGRHALVGSIHKASKNIKGVAHDGAIAVGGRGKATGGVIPEPERAIDEV